MALKLHNLKSSANSRKLPKRRGRGDAAGQGSYSGRGQKGQRSRSGGRGGLKQKGLRNLLLSTPKLGGFRSLKPRATAVNLELLERKFSDGAEITQAVLKERGLIRGDGKKIKILAQGNLTKKFIIKGCLASAAAKEKILKAGGQI